MFLSAKQVAAMIATAAMFVSCGRGTQTDDKRSKDGEEPGFSLTVPQDKWAASKYCGDVRPDLPENPTPPHRFDTAFLNGKLKGEGLLGWIHGSVPTYQQYVFTYRSEDANDPMAFFKAEQFSLVPATAEIAKTFATLKRHDKVLLKGSVFDNGSPLTHLTITSIEVQKKYEGAPENHYSFDLAQLNGQKTFKVFGLVHATVDSKTMGRAFVVEHKDLLMPLAVPPQLNDLAAPLYRGDIVNVAVKVVEHPHGPPHFEVDADADKPLEIVDPMLNCHNLEKEVSGTLVLFPKSPAISRDVYAIRIVDGNGVGRNYTLFPDTEDMDEFMRIFNGLSEKADAAWKASPEEAQVVRNFWSKQSIKVKAKGRLNVVSTEQANAQVYIKSADDLTIEGN